jgi:hypothetical protein
VLEYKVGPQIRKKRLQCKDCIEVIDYKEILQERLRLDVQEKTTICMTIT